ncbi:polymorphic outer membrane protein middle domain-containing protein [Chlamydiifrater phoenicopteri]|uniref:polymorphic outer membrane protein middle domain-containing protein n=1 Tax=Chlamydiifrater phoenicopteri TaxID=2681469 RepID=UPI001BCC7592|nr:polymorphic outer membrane protein middle domain-containing protein [Chlamydiifrater phoenicopteri]
MLTNKRFLTLLLSGLLHPSFLSATGTTPQNIGSIEDLISEAPQNGGNLVLTNNIFDSNQLYKSPNEENSNNSTVKGVIDNTSNLTIDGNNHCFCFSNICVESPNGVSPCFINCGNTLTLQNFAQINGNQLSQIIKNGTASSSSSSFISAKNVSILNNKQVCFENSCSLFPTLSNGVWHPGLIRAYANTSENISLFNNTGDGTLSIKKNGSVIFRNNHCQQKGILSGNKIHLESNQSLIFENNYSMREGGAIACVDMNTAEVTIKNNTNVLFRNNFGSQGGAFTCYNKMDLTNNESIIFDNNRSSDSGGAIHLQESSTSEVNNHAYLVRGNKDIIFSRNISQKGPAISLNSNSNIQLGLFADKGDITFLQNIKIDTNNEPQQCCSIELQGSSLTDTGKLRFLCASEGHSINFYDPIFCEAGLSESTNHDLSINGPHKEDEDSQQTSYAPFEIDSNEAFTGTILFSAQQIPQFLKQNSEPYEASRITVLPTRVYLKNGILAIGRDTILKCRLFTQDGGLLKLSANSKLETAWFTRIKDLSLDLGSFDQLILSDTPALIQLDGGQRSLQGVLSFCNSDKFASYDQHPLGVSKRVNILKVEAPRTEDGKQFTNNSQLETKKISINPSTGYAGTLEFEWDGGTDPSNKKNLYATWTPTGYNASPEFRSPTFLNTSWMGVAATKAISSPLLPEKQPHFKHGLFGLSAEALISSLNIRPSRGDENLHFSGNGYAIGCFLGSQTSSVEIRLGKLDGQAFNQKFNEEVNSSYYLGNLSFKGSTNKTPLGEMYSSFALSYAYADNNIYASFPEDFFGRRLSFHSTNFLAELMLAKPLTGHGLSPHFSSTTPFLKAAFCVAKNPGCTETELTNDVITRQILVPVHSFVQKLMIPPPIRLRKYSPSTLYNLSISPGVSTESTAKWNIFPVSLRLAAALSVDPYKVTPKTTMIIIQNAFPVPVRGMSLARCSAEVASSFQIKLLPSLTSYVDYKGNFSTRNISNSLKLGSSLIF